MRRIAVLLSLLLFTPFVFAQPLQEENWDAVKVYDYYKDCVVDIETTITLEDGRMMRFGGSGFFRNKEGEVATVGHVVKEKDDKIEIGGFFGPGQILKITSYEYFVTLTSKNRKYKAELIGANVYKDTAKLKVLDIDPADYSAARFGTNPDNLKVGETVYAVGAPFGLSNSLTSGKVSAIHRYIDLWYLEDYIQTDCPINPGNSGSPLIDSRGNVIGLNDAGIRSADGMAFAVSMKLFSDEELKKGDIALPWFGAEAMVQNFARMGTSEKPRFQDLDELYRKTRMDDPESLSVLAKLTYKDNWGVVVAVDETKVNGKNCPAKQAGIKRGDLLTKVNGKNVKSGMDVRLAIMDSAVDQQFEVELIRIEKYGVAKTMTVKVTLQNIPKSTAALLSNGRTVCLRCSEGRYSLCVEIPYPNDRLITAVLPVKVKMLR